jgi:hypothetical protein
MTGDYSLYIVFGLTVAQGGSTYGSMFSASSSDGLFTLGTRLSRYLGGDNVLAQPLALSTVHDLLYVSSATTSVAYMNGQNSATPNLGDASVSFVYMGVDNSNEYFKGYFMEIAVWPSLLTSADALSLHEYRLGKYPATF